MNEMNAIRLQEIEKEIARQMGVETIFEAILSIMSISGICSQMHLIYLTCDPENKIEQ